MRREQSTTGEGGRPRILVLSASQRADGHNARLAAAATKALALMDMDATRIGLGDYPMPVYDEAIEARAIPENAQKLAAQFRAHDGLFIASPEHNSSFPAGLKNALDWMSRKGISGGHPMRGRVVALGSASPGTMGGIRCLMGLRPLLEIGYGMLVVPGQISVPRAGEAFAADGTLADEGAAGRLRELLGTLTRLAAIA